VGAGLLHSHHASTLPCAKPFLQQSISVHTCQLEARIISHHPKYPLRTFTVGSPTAHRSASQALRWLAAPTEDYLGTYVAKGEQADRERWVYAWLHADDSMFSRFAPRSSFFAYSQAHMYLYVPCTYIHLLSPIVNLHCQGYSVENLTGAADGRAGKVYVGLSPRQYPLPPPVISQRTRFTAVPR